MGVGVGVYVFVMMFELCCFLGDTISKCGNTFLSVDNGFAIFIIYEFT